MLLVLCCSGVLAAAATPTAAAPGSPQRGDDMLTAAYRQRAAAYLRWAAEPTPPGGSGLFMQVARLELASTPLDADVINAALDFVNARHDTADFLVAGFVRMLLQYAGSPMLSPELRQRLERTLLDFKYWIDEPGVDSMCYYSENHQILFASAEYLVGNHFADVIFTNDGRTGREHSVAARDRIENWLRRRFYFGFSEWHSNVYYNEDLPALVNLADFAPDESVAVRAAIVLDALFFELVNNTHDGIFGVSHGRTYDEHVLGARRESTSVLMNLLSGAGLLNSRGNMTSISLAASRRYTPAGAVLAAAADQLPERVSRQRMGVRLEDAAAHGLSFADKEDGIFFWGMGAYADWRTIDLTFSMIDTYNLWENDFFKPFAYLRPAWAAGLLAELSRPIRSFTSGSVLSEVNTYSYRTPDYMLASAQNNRVGYFGFQQHTWQATIDLDAVVFTSHPGTARQKGDGYRSYWTGGWFPKVVQEKNALIAIYDVKPLPALVPELAVPYTHAYFPRAAFDEVRQIGHWTLGRRNNAYVGLYSSRATRWATGGEWPGSELIADGTDNVWICQLGNQTQLGSFDDFSAAVTSAEVRVIGTNVTYDAPGLGRAQVSLDTPFKIDGEPIAITDYERFDNPYALHAFGANPFSLGVSGYQLEADFELPARLVSAPATATVQAH